MPVTPHLKREEHQAMYDQTTQKFKYNECESFREIQKIKCEEKHWIKKNEIFALVHCQLTSLTLLQMNYQQHHNFNGFNGLLVRALNSFHMTNSDIDS